jgi:peptidyl-prolyl cis-trans isomerase A (cyclophilin A)
MIRRILLSLLVPLFGWGCSQGGPDKAAEESAAPANASASVTTAEKAPEPLPDTVKVRIETEIGAITIAVDVKHAPITATNFIRYVDAHRFDGTTFYRAARAIGNDKEGFIQGGIRRDYTRMYPPIAHEPTTRTGLRHVTGAVSMAYREPGDAMGDFFILTHAAPDMDAKGDKPGFAVFGKVIDGMPTVRKILAEPTIKGGSGPMKDQIIAKSVRIVKAERID